MATQTLEPTTVQDFGAALVAFTTQVTRVAGVIDAIKPPEGRRDG